MLAAIALLALLGAAPAAPAADSVPREGAVGAPAATRDSGTLGRHNVPAWPVYFKWDSGRGRSVRIFGPVTAISRAPGHTAFYPIFPVTGVLRDDDGHREHRLLWPLVSWGSGDGYRCLGALPFYYGLRDSDTRLVTVPPLYWHMRKPGHEQRLFMPLYGKFVGPYDSTTVVLNAYRRAKPGYACVGLFPFCERAVAGDSGRSFAVPFWYHSWSADAEARFVAPAWGEWRSDADSTSAKLLFPLWCHFQGPRHDVRMITPAWVEWRSKIDGSSLLCVLGPVYRRQVRGPTNRCASVLWWLFRDETRGERRRSMLQPLYYVDRPSKENVFVSVLGGLLFSYERAGRAREVRVMFLPVRRWQG